MPSAEANTKPIKLTPSMELYQEVGPARKGAGDTGNGSLASIALAVNCAGRIEMKDDWRGGDPIGLRAPRVAPIGYGLYRR